MNRHVLGCALALFIVPLSSVLVADPPTQTAKENPVDGDRGAKLFEQTILPTLSEHCYSCHSRSADTIEAGLELDSPSGLRRGGDSGPMLQPHSIDQSNLLLMLRHDEDVSAMPPEMTLPEETITAFEQWIELGAPDTREDTGPTAKEMRMEKGRQHWAFRPPTFAMPPAVKDSAWSRDKMIDPFILSAMEAKGIKPVADAAPQTLIRRLYFDLIGLPPPPADVDAFVADPSPEAIEKLVDRLLDSPQFGERWGRHWLDVVRYAESSGMEFNFTYPHAWPFRNYVIDSLNADKPFDEFLREQIAGDLLPAEDASPQQIEARKIATSMLAFGPKRHNSSGTEFQMDMADDQIDVVFKSTLAMTVSCARCHDHKFDPIPTSDYYALAGIFLSTEPLYGTIKQKYSNTPTDLLPIGENALALHEAAVQFDQQLADLEKTLKAKLDELKKAKATQKVAVEKKSAPEETLVAVTTDVKKSKADSLTSEPSSIAGKQPEVLIKTLNAEIMTLQASLAELKGQAPPRPPYAMSVRDRAKPKDTKLAVRGDFRTRGDVVPRGFMTAIEVPDAPEIDSAGSGRLELAQWITSPENPLTARVMVNRIWHHLFGQGIVPTVDNFGLIGKSPTHPELLDMLAIRFVEERWSIKRMVKAIVLSRAYQLSSHPDPNNTKIDPDNRRLWRSNPRRLQAEAIRDAILSVSGRLDLQRPEGSTVTALGDKLVRSIPLEKIQPASNHRSVYLPVVRDYVPEIFDLFDFPSPSLVSGQRAVTNVPSQALYLRNSEFVAEQSKHAAIRLLAVEEATDDTERVSLAMRWALGRIPSELEMDAAIELIDEVRSASSNKALEGEQAAWSAWFLTLFSTAEFRFLVD